MTENLDNTGERSADDDQEVMSSFFGRIGGRLGAVGARFGLLEISEPTEEGRISKHLQRVVSQENELIDIRAAANSSNRMRFVKGYKFDPEQQAQIMNDYTYELSGRESLLEHFALFMDERYFDYTYTLDLAETVEAASHEAIAELKEQYLDLRSRLEKRDLIEGEIPREYAEINFNVRPCTSDEDYVVVERYRKLFCFERDGHIVSVCKRMTFLMLQHDEVSLGDAPIKKLSPKQAQRVQKLVDTESDDVVPIRTVYFATNKQGKED